jgi:hypothetical protein
VGREEGYYFLRDLCPQEGVDRPPESSHVWRGVSTWLGTLRPELDIDLNPSRPVVRWPEESQLVDGRCGNAVESLYLNRRGSPSGLGRRTHRGRKIYQYLPSPIFVMGNSLCGVLCRDSHGSAHNGVGSETAVAQVSQQYGPMKSQADPARNSVPAGPHLLQ